MEIKYYVALFLIFIFILFPQTGYEVNGPLINHFTWIFCHANVFHLFGNIVCLLMLKKKLFLIPAFIISVVASFVPVWSIGGSYATMGFSGVLFAIIGIKYGDVGRLKLCVKNCLPWIVISIFFPHMNWCIHLYCLVIGYLYGAIGRRYITRTRS